MITELQPEQQLAFQSLLMGFYGNCTSGEMIQKLRSKSWDRFLELGLPTRKNDVYRYVPLKNLYALEMVQAPASEVSRETALAHVLPECKGAALVFINGRFSPAHSQTESIPSRVVILPIEEAVKTYGNNISAQWTKATKEEQDPFAAMNLALHRDGLYFYVPPKTVMDKPIQLLYLNDTAGSAALIMPRVQGFVGAQSEVAFVSTQAAISGDKYAFNGVVDIAIEDACHIKYTQAACDLGKNCWHFDALRATIKRDSKLTTVMATDGSATVRHDYRVALLGENGDVHLNGVSMLNGSCESHVHVLIDHQAPNCKSLQLFKGALADFSHSAFEGKIMVRREAQKTEAFQLNNNLLLSDRAHADSKPNLEIFADDVKASHGSTVGQLDSDQIFYMKTRGFSENEAKSILVKGYCAEVIDKIEIGSIQDKMRQKAATFLG